MKVINWIFSQLFELERKFYHKKYLASSERKKLAQLLNLTDIQVSENVTSTSVKFKTVWC